MSRMKDVYENLTEYANVINARIRDYEELENDLEFLNENKISQDNLKGKIEALKTVEEELERILDGRGLENGSEVTDLC